MSTPPTVNFRDLSLAQITALLAQAEEARKAAEAVEDRTDVTNEGFVTDEMTDLHQSKTIRICQTYKDKACYDIRDNLRHS